MVDLNETNWYEVQVVYAQVHCLSSSSDCVISTLATKMADVVLASENVAGEEILEGPTYRYLRVPLHFALNNLGTAPQNINIQSRLQRSH